MPLKPGKKNMGFNFEELMSSYGKKKKIGKIVPKSRKHAAKISAAVAYKKSGER